jgi:hypothetical protein
MAVSFIGGENHRLVASNWQIQYSDVFSIVHKSSGHNIEQQNWKIAEVV